jgi:hypothetical protein
MTTPLFDHRWEKRLHEELRKLPEMDAPASLVPNVMAVIRARQEMMARAWWQRPATTWPLALQAALGAVALALFAMLVLAGHAVAPAVASPEEAGLVAQAGAKLGSLWNTSIALVNALGLVVQETLSPVLLAVIAGACFSYVALLGIGGALWRSVLQHAHE